MTNCTGTPHAHSAAQGSRRVGLGYIHSRRGIPRTRIMEGERVKRGRLILDAVPHKHVEIFEEHRDDCRRMNEK